MINILKHTTRKHYVKSVQIRSFFCSVFSRIRTEYGEILQENAGKYECGKIRTRKNSIFKHFSDTENVQRMASKWLQQSFFYRTLLGDCFCSIHVLICSQSLEKFASWTVKLEKVIHLREASQLLCNAICFIKFYIMETLALNGLIQKKSLLSKKRLLLK